MTKVFYPGTFDPPTLGHQNIIMKAASLFGSVLVGVGHNRSKPSPLFSPEERIEMVQLVTKEVENVHVEIFQGLVVDYALKNDCQVIIRSFRNSADVDFELAMADHNKKVSGLETIFLFPDSEFRSISASLVKELGMGGKSLHYFVPAEIEPQVLKRLKDQS